MPCHAMPCRVEPCHARNDGHRQLHSILVIDHRVERVMFVVCHYHFSNETHIEIHFFANGCELKINGSIETIG